MKLSYPNIHIGAWRLALHRCVAAAAMTILLTGNAFAADTLDRALQAGISAAQAASQRGADSWVAYRDAFAAAAARDNVQTIFLGNDPDPESDIDAQGDGTIVYGKIRVNGAASRVDELRKFCWFNGRTSERTLKRAKQLKWRYRPIAWRHPGNGNSYYLDQTFVVWGDVESPDHIDRSQRDDGVGAGRTPGRADSWRVTSGVLFRDSANDDEIILHAGRGNCFVRVR